MCDYSLVAVASRPARVADRLITTGFQNSSTRGFASTEDMKMAVCLRPGTEIAFDHPPTIIVYGDVLLQAMLHASGR